MRHTHKRASQAGPPPPKRYLVTGPRAMSGVEPGGYVYLSLTEGQEQALFLSGWLEEALEESVEEEEAPEEPAPEVNKAPEEPAPKKETKPFWGKN